MICQKCKKEIKNTNTGSCPLCGNTIKTESAKNEGVSYEVPLNELLDVSPTARILHG